MTRPAARLTATVSLAAALLAALPAAARIPRMVRPATRPAYVEFLTFGPTIIFGGGSALQVELSGGYHLLGGGDGPALGGSLQLIFGGGGFGLQVGPRFRWDIQPVRGIGFYIAPGGMVGFSLATSAFGGAIGAFLLGFGVETRLVLNDRWALLFRPLWIELNAYGGGVLGTYDVMMGGGITF